MNCALTTQLVVKAQTESVLLQVSSSPQTCYPIWLTFSRGPSLLGSLPVATLVECKSWKSRMDQGLWSYAGKASFPLFRVDCYEGCWLWLYSHPMHVYIFHCQ